MSEAEPYAPQPLARWYYAGAVAAILFMGLGCLMYVWHVTIDPATLPLDQRNAMLAEPAWVRAAFAVTVWSGLAGAVLLLLRRQTAEPVLLVSLASAVVWIAGLATTAGLRASMTVNDWVVMIAIAAIIWTIYWFARHSRQRGWLR